MQIGRLYEFNETVQRVVVASSRGDDVIKSSYYRDNSHGKKIKRRNASFENSFIEWLEKYWSVIYPHAYPVL